MILRIIDSFGVLFVSSLAAVVLLRQCRRPQWWPGRLYVRLMNRTHASLTAWGLEQVSIGERDTILDVGCGGGRTISTLARSAPSGKIFGADYSRESVAVSKKTNAALIDAGRVDVREASVSRLPFGNETFDLVTAVETHYYWPNPVSDFREVLRVLKPGGKLLLIAEVFKHGSADFAHPLAMRIVGGRCPAIGEVVQQLTAAGFTTVQTREEPHKGWLSVVTTKSGTAAPAA